nr:tripartite motif-containing protein 45-like [Crassostrea gigas]
MDSRTKAQDIYRCELCEENKVDMLCVVCPRKLCKSCVGNHLDDDPSSHKLIKYQDRNTTFVFPTCPTHSSERCKNFCQECDKAVCPSCISSDSHERHKFLKIFETFETRKKIILNDINELEEIVFTSYSSIVQQAESEATTLEEVYKALKQSIEDYRTKWHDEIDKIVNMLQNETDEMRDIQLKALNKHLLKVKELRSAIPEAIKMNKGLLHSPNVTKILSYKSRNSALKCYPQKLEVSIPKFILQPINGDLSAEMFAVIVGCSISENIEGYKKNKQNIRQRAFLDKPKIQSVLETEMKCLYKVACQSNGKLWVAGKFMFNIETC